METKKEKAKNQEKETQNYKCPKCKKLFASRKRLTRHLNTTHSEARPHKCPICDSSFKRSDHLKRHMLKHKPDRERIFKCDKCTKSFFTQDTLRKHKRFVHEKELPYKCEWENCGKQFRKRSKLKYHIAKDHKHKKPYKCKVCKSRFDHPSQLKRHQRIHTKEKTNICLQCGMAFMKFYELQKHIKQMHPRIFKCKVCQKEYTNKKSYERHIKKHNPKDFLFVCKHEGCNKIFSCQGSLDVHIKVKHSNTKAHCAKCGKTLSSTSALIKHQKTSCKGVVNNIDQIKIDKMKIVNGIGNIGNNENIENIEKNNEKNSISTQF
ncbi:zinc finger protein [Anaeramoeba flamelloides]|uniref:Zinc finger protein n=1 Tax=Anaeramoeba flamelloides TaxID=1746091 RepID=A0AAV7YGF9_9EUKA|nr:zinc finger protein [Anaeramoeba flamelloides]